MRTVKNDQRIRASTRGMNRGSEFREPTENPEGDKRCRGVTVELRPGGAAPRYQPEIGRGRPRL